jgi:hypothetical protein
MEAQADLVTPLAEFQPRIVKMAPEGRKAPRGRSKDKSKKRRR